MQAFDQLLEKYLDEDLTVDELEDFLVAVKVPANQEILERVLTGSLEAKSYQQLPGEKDMESLFVQMLQRAEAIAQEAPPAAKSRIINMRRLFVAASILLLVGFGAYFFFFNKKEPVDGVVKTTPVMNDVKAPQTNRAMITLASGEKVYVDSISNGQISLQGNTKLVKVTDGQIVYESATDLDSSVIQYNTLENPRGSRVINITLADGSKVWLNAASSVTYPVAFTGKERKVSVTGEAYFEVSHDALKPFYVTKDGLEVQVLGTHFNVNAFNDEPDIKVTLLEGSVKVSNGSLAAMLKPGQQALMSGNRSPLIQNDIDIEHVMAWKNGRFSFERADIQTVMRELARWYDLEVEFAGTPTKDIFGGDMQRDLPLSKVLEFLRNSQVHFEVENRKVIVKP